MTVHPHMINIVLLDVVCAHACLLVCTRHYLREWCYRHEKDIDRTAGSDVVTFSYNNLLFLAHIYRRAGFHFLICSLLYQGWHLIGWNLPSFTTVRSLRKRQELRVQKLVRRKFDLLPSWFRSTLFSEYKPRNRNSAKKKKEKKEEKRKPKMEWKAQRNLTRKKLRNNRQMRSRLEDVFTNCHKLGYLYLSSKHYQNRCNSFRIPSFLLFLQLSSVCSLISTSFLLFFRVHSLFLFWCLISSFLF